MLFDWFKLNSDEFALEIQPVEAAELTRNILIDWIPIFEDKQVDYDIDIPEQPVRVRLDMDSYMTVSYTHLSPHIFYGRFQVGGILMHIDRIPVYRVYQRAKIGRAHV